MIFFGSYVYNYLLCKTKFFLVLKHKIMIANNNRLALILSVAGLILLLPLVAMQFTNEVNWSVFDFVVAGILLFGICGVIELALRKINTINQRVWVVLGILLVLFLIWAELAVGIFGTPFAGN